MKKLLLTSCLLFNMAALALPDPFEGHFTMTVSSPSLTGRHQPPILIWTIKNTHAFMGTLEGPKKIPSETSTIFDASDTTLALTWELGKIKRASRMHAYEADSVKRVSEIRTMTVKKSKDLKIIEGYRCKKFILETNESIAEVWVTDKLNFDLCRYYKMMTHCSILSRFTLIGDWYDWKDMKGMILGISSRKKGTEDFYEINISDIKPGPVSDSVFDLSPYRVTEVPPGANCGSVVRTK